MKTRQFRLIFIVLIIICGVLIFILLDLNAILDITFKNSLTADNIYQDFGRHLNDIIHYLDRITH